MSCDMNISIITFIFHISMLCEKYSTGFLQHAKRPSDPCTATLLRTDQMVFSYLLSIDLKIKNATDL